MELKYFVSYIFSTSDGRVGAGEEMMRIDLAGCPDSGKGLEYIRGHIRSRIRSGFGDDEAKVTIMNLRLLGDEEYAFLTGEKEHEDRIG